MPGHIYKENDMRNVLLVVVFTCFLSMTWAVSYAGNLPAADQDLIKSAGIPIYVGAEFVNGNHDVGFRFATSNSPEDVRAWYTKQLSAWSLYSEYGGWILYEGKPGLGLGNLIMKIKQVQVQNNSKMSEWFGIDREKSTEVVILIPR